MLFNLLYVSLFVFFLLSKTLLCFEVRFDIYTDVNSC
jgi:hypothetical protein